MCIGDDTRLCKESNELITTELDTKRRDTQSLQCCFLQNCSYEFDESGLSIVVGRRRSPGSEIDPCEDDLLATASHEVVYLLDDLFHRSPLVSSTCLYRETEGTEVVAPRLDHHVFACEEFPSCDLPQ